MAAKIKLKRMGKKKEAFYRVIVQDESFSVRGRVVEEIGFYNPRLPDSKLDVKKEKVLDWIAKGARPTEKVRILLGKAGILPAISFEGKSKRAKKVKGEAAAEAAPAAAAAPAPQAKPAEASKEEAKKE